MKRVAAITLVLFAACLGCSCGNGDESERIRSSHAEPVHGPAPAPRGELVEFRPLPDPVAVDLWGRVAMPGARRQLAAHYEQTGYRAMASFVRVSEAVDRGEAPAVDALLRLRQPSLVCPVDEDEEAVNAAIAEISENVSADDYAAALRNAERAVQTFGPSCALSIEVALVKLAAAAFGNDLRPDDFELSMRTLVTADVEMDWSAYSLAREWPYQVLAQVQLARGDAASAVVSTEIALAYLRARRARGDTITPAIEEQLRKLAEAARAALRDRSSDR